MVAAWAKRTITPEREAELQQMAAENPPPGQVVDAPSDVRPKGRPRGRAANKPVKSVIEAATASLLTTLNSAVVVAGSVLHSAALAADRLDSDEIVLLTDALTAEAMAHPRLAKMLTSAGNVGPHWQMAMALVTIAHPRLVRHGIIPGAADTPLHMEAGGAPFGSGGYGERQEYGDVVPIAVA